MKNLKTKTKYDLFSKEISLYFKGSGYFSTLFGKIATVIYITLYVTLLIYYSLLGILKKKGTFTSEKAITEEIPNFNISKNNLYFTYSLEDPETYDNIRDDEIYYTEAYYKHGKRVGDNWVWEQKKLEVGPCEVEYFGEKYKDLLKLKPYKTFTCVKEINEHLLGHFVYDEYSFIYVQIFPCVNDTTHRCKPQEIIDKYMNGTFIDFQMQSVLIDMENYKVPIKENFENVYTTVGRGFKRELHIYFKVVNFQDYGFFGESLGQKKYLQYDYDQPMFVLNSDLQKNESICDVTIKLADKTLIVKREYYTLIDVFSKLGGVMDLILKVVTVILFFPVTALFDVNVINELFQFDEKNKETLYKGISNQNIFRTGTLGYRNNVKNFNTKNALKRVKSVYERKIILDNERKRTKFRSSMSPKKKIERPTNMNNYNSKDYILNNINSIPQINNNISIINNYGSINNNLNKKLHSKKKDNNNKHNIDERKIIKLVKLNRLDLCLFSLFPNKFTNENSILLKIGLGKFREELDVAKLFRVGLLNNRAIEILKKNSSLLSFDKKDLVINTEALCEEGRNKNNI